MIVIVALLVAVFVLLRMRSRLAETAAEQPTRTSRRKNTTYHAVSITFEENACMAAREMAGRRFLATAAPRLPLPDCDVLECRCRFAHHDDRRSGKDRRTPFGPAGRLSATGKFEEEQRTGRDRRESEF